jgi:cell division transport system permease protein
MIQRGLKRSLSDFKRHPWLHLVSISTITLSLLVLGFFFLCDRNFENVAEKSGPQLCGTLYLKDGLTKIQVSSLREKILSLLAVQKVTFKTRTSIMDELQVFLGNAGSNEAVPGGELFPDVLEIELRRDTPTATVTELKNSLSQMFEVSEVDFSEDWLAQFKKIRQFLQMIGITLMVSLMVGCSLIIANFMGMRHQSRKAEIEIVKLIGASQPFILGPFLWEALIEGILGVTLALMALFAVKVLLSALISVQWATILGMREFMYLSPQQFFMLILMGIAMAFMGSFTVFMRFKDSRRS